MNMKRLRAWLVLALSLVTSAASAERGTVQLTGGGQVSGELVEYVPGDHVTVAVGSGPPLVLKASEVVAVRVGGEAANGPVPAAAPARPAYDPHVQGLALRQRELLSQRVGLGGPIAMLAGGAAMALVGWGILFPVSREASCDDFFIVNADGTTDSRSTCEDWPAGAVAGAVLGSLGLGVAIAGAALLPSAVVRRRARNAELEQINGELRARGFALSVTPWLRASARPSGGLTARITF